MEPESGQGSKEEPHTTSILSQQWVGYQERGIRLIALVAAKLRKSKHGEGEIHHKGLHWCKFNKIINFCKFPRFPFGFHWDFTTRVCLWQVFCQCIKRSPSILLMHLSFKHCDLGDY